MIVTTKAKSSGSTNITCTTVVCFLVGRMYRPAAKRSAASTSSTPCECASTSTASASAPTATIRIDAIFRTCCFIAYVLLVLILKKHS